MQLKTILNRVERYKSFVYGRVSWMDDPSDLKLRVEIAPRANSRPVCSGCERVGSTYDHLPERTFEFVPLWQIPVLFVYAMRRVDCPQCGVKVEQVPWADGKCRQTTTYRWFLARWAKRLSWREVADVFQTSWDTVYRAVDYAVKWGLVHRDETGVEAIGIDEIQWQRGHHYLTLVYQIDAGRRRLLWVAKERTEKTLTSFFDLFEDWLADSLQYVCSDMWQPYLKIVAERTPGAMHVLDRYHLMAKLNQAVDEVRRGEAKQLQDDGYEPILKHSRWCLLKRPENLTDRQTVKLAELLKYNLKSMRAYLLREDFQRFWSYSSPAWARRFLREWCTRSMRSRLEPLKSVARSFRTHEELLLNWFRAKGTISAGIVEGFNNKAKLTMRKSYGFRTYEVLETVLYHNLGKLPQPNFTHEFC